MATAVEQLASEAEYAAGLLQQEADCLKECHTIPGSDEWPPSDVAAHGEYLDMMTSVSRLLEHSRAALELEKNRAAAIAHALEAIDSAQQSCWEGEVGGWEIALIRKLVEGVFAEADQRKR